MSAVPEERDYTTLLSWASSSALSCIVMVMLYHSEILSGLLFQVEYSEQTFWDTLFQILLNDVLLRNMSLLIKIAVVLNMERFAIGTNNTRRVIYFINKYMLISNNLESIMWFNRSFIFCLQIFNTNSILVSLVAI
jgi:hypothetical protein